MTLLYNYKRALFFPQQFKFWFWVFRVKSYQDLFDQKQKSTFFVGHQKIFIYNLIEINIFIALQRCGKIHNEHIVDLQQIYILWYRKNASRWFHWDDATRRNRHSAHYWYDYHGYVLRPGEYQLKYLLYDINIYIIWFVWSLRTYRTRL